MTPPHVSKNKPEWVVHAKRLLTVAGFMVFLAGQAQARSDQEAAEAFLYFAGPQGSHLRAAAMAFKAGTDRHKTAVHLLEALFAGPPASSGLQQIFADQTRVNALFITNNGDCYVDLAMDAGQNRPIFDDAITEYLAIYSLVNTLTVNIPEIRQVKVLVNEQETAGPGGHISLAPFYRTNMLIVQ